MIEGILLYGVCLLTICPHKKKNIMTIKSKIVKFILLLLGASFFSCNHHNGIDDYDVTNININDLLPEDSVCLSDIMEISKYIVLETPGDEHLVGEITKIIHADSKFIILDQITSSIFIFEDTDGKMISHISRLGRGHGEYLSIIDIAYNTKDKTIGVLAPHKMITYDCNGNCIKEDAKFKYFASFMDYMSDGTIALCPFYSSNIINGHKVHYNLILTDSCNTYKKGFLNFDEQLFTRQTGQTFAKEDNNTLLFFQRYDDYIYSINEDGVKPYYKIDYGNSNKKIGDEIANLAKQENRNPYKIYEIEKEKKYCSLLQFYSMKNWIYFTYQQGDNFNYVLFSKTDLRGRHYKASVLEKENPIPFINDLDATPFYYFILGYGDNQLLSFTSPEYLMASKCVNNDKLYAIQNKLKAGGNYVLVEFNIKPTI